MTLCPASLTCGLLLCAALWNIPDVVAVEATEFLVPIGNNVSFPCNETSEPVWVIATTNGTLITDRKNDRHQLTENRIFPQNDSDGREYLTVQATAANNNSIIRCRSKGISPDFYLFAKLKVLGPPSYPELLQSINATALLLSWSPPFTFANYEILMYSIKMVNTCDGDTVVRNIDAAHDDTIITEYFHTPNGEATQSCSLLEFAVSATSAIGESRPGNISGGFPIVPQIDSEDVLMIITSFQSNLSPLINIRFQAPRVCPFQSANYTILMDRVGTNQTITIGPTPYYYRPSSTIEIWVNSSLVVNEEYSITAVFSSLAGSVSLPNVTVSTTTDTSHPPTQSLAIPVIVGAAVGAVAVLVLMVMLIMCAIVCLCCFRISRKRSKPAATLTTYQGAPPTPMSLNPLYEGSGTDESLEHYENLDPYLVDERHVTGPMLCPPMIPPPRNGMDANAWLPSGKSLEQLSTSNEQYTVMTSAGTLADPQTTDGQITYTLPNDAERYVINDPK